MGPPCGRQSNSKIAVVQVDLSGWLFKHSHVVARQHVDREGQEIEVVALTMRRDRCNGESSGDHGRDKHRLGTRNAGLDASGASCRSAFVLIDGCPVSGTLTTPFGVVGISGGEVQEMPNRPAFECARCRGVEGDRTEVVDECGVCDRRSSKGTVDVYGIGHIVGARPRATR